MAYEEKWPGNPIQYGCLMLVRNPANHILSKTYWLWDTQREPKAIKEKYKEKMGYNYI